MDEEDERAIEKVVKETLEEASAKEMVEKAKKLSKDGVEVKAPKLAVETVARSSKFSSPSNPWEPRRTFNPNLEKTPGMHRAVEFVRYP
eukprot:1396474-Karenia_brevis.AAC.1